MWSTWLLSAATCGVLWASLGIVVGAATIGADITTPDGPDITASPQLPIVYVTWAVVTYNFTDTLVNPPIASTVIRSIPLTAPLPSAPTSICATITWQQCQQICSAGNVYDPCEQAEYVNEKKSWPPMLDIATIHTDLLPVSATPAGLATVDVTPTSPDNGGAKQTTEATSTHSGGLISGVQATAAVSTSSKSPNIGAIVGGVVGGVLIVLIVLGAVFFLRRRHRTKSVSRDFGALEKNRESSPSVYPVAGINYDTPVPSAQQSPVPAITPVESHHLMDEYPVHSQGEIAPVVGAAKPYAVNNEREVDDDGVSLRSPSPVQEGRGSGERDSVPRLPIYNRNAGATTDRGPAL